MRYRKAIFIIIGLLFVCTYLSAYAVCSKYGAYCNDGSGTDVVPIKWFPALPFARYKFCGFPNNWVVIINSPLIDLDRISVHPSLPISDIAKATGEINPSGKLQINP
jgi:hypothetical protein